MSGVARVADTFSKPICVASKAIGGMSKPDDAIVLESFAPSKASDAVSKLSLRLSKATHALTKPPRTLSKAFYVVSTPNLPAVQGRCRLVQGRCQTVQPLARMGIRAR